MELNLRKARKLEVKLRNVIETASPTSSARVRALGTPAERAEALAQARKEFLNQNDLLLRLIGARFAIRKAIAKANAETGINDLMNRREELQAILSKSQAGVEQLNVNEVEDMAQARKATLERGDRIGEAAVSMILAVATKEDVEAFKKADEVTRKRLEGIEDELAQKNVGVKITLDQETQSLLQTVGLL